MSTVDAPDVPLVHIVDDTFVAAAPAALARHIGDPNSWRRWWPDLELTLTEDRGVKGVRWTVSGALTGTSEIWLEPWGDGVLVHFYLRADPTARGPRRATVRPRRVHRLREHRRRSWKRTVHALKDAVEAGRPPGVPPRHENPGP